MSNIEPTEIQIKIAQIIERSRHQEERFLIDSKAAAADIIQFLQTCKLVNGFYHNDILESAN